MAWVVLHLPPPDTFTFCKTFPVFSNTVTSLPCTNGIFAAAKQPAAPAPIIAMFKMKIKRKSKGLEFA
jgi:hypothetical protein